MRRMDVDNFLNLPDWQKIELKRTTYGLNRFPLQTLEQELNRRVVMLEICALFNNRPYYEFVSGINQSTLDGLWPTGMELFITPRLLDVMPVFVMTEYAMCYCCKHYCGYSGSHYLLRREFAGKRKVISLFGSCQLAKEVINPINQDLIRVQPEHRCIGWFPTIFYSHATEMKIKRWLKNPEIDYAYEDYMRDLGLVNIFDFFQNRYRRTRG